MSDPLIRSKRTSYAACLTRRLGVLLAATAFIAQGFHTPVRAGSLTSLRNFAQAFDIQPGDKKDFTAVFIEASAPGSAFWPGEQAEMTIQISNTLDQPLKASGKFLVVQYATTTPDPDDGFMQAVEKVADVGEAAVAIDIPAKGFVDQKVTLPVPENFGAYAVFLQIDGHGRQFVAQCIRVPKAAPGKVQYPSYAIDVMAPEVAPMFKRIGVKGTRIEAGWALTTDANSQYQWKGIEEYLKVLHENDITVLMTVSTGGGQQWMPLGTMRSYLNEKDEGPMGYPGDFTALPQYDPDFQKWNQMLVENFGWPKGPVNAIELWNEPWEGISISGWGADMPRYRDLYTAMAEGIVAGRASSGNEVLIGGTCSSMNTEDKLFGDGKDDFLKWLDFTSIHYQPMTAQPALIKKFVNRESPNGPVRVWDTESWIANSEDRVAAVIASMRSLGQSRTAGVNHENAREISDVQVRQADGTTKPRRIVQALAPAAAIAATQQFIGERPFKEILFKNGLPWIYVFQDPAQPDDGSIAIVGDLSGVYPRGLLLYRSVNGVNNQSAIENIQKQLDALPPTGDDADRQRLTKELSKASVLTGGTLSIDNPSGIFSSFDFYGNPVASAGGKVVVPLNGLGYFVRGDGSAGSFDKLIEAVRKSRIDGYEPIDVIAHDLLATIGEKPTLKLTLTNILNRPVSGKLDVKLGVLALDGKDQAIEFQPHETKVIELKITGGESSPDNTYPLTFGFDAGADGKASHTELMHVNVIAKATIAVDGKLDDWQNALPQPIRAQAGAGKNLTEKAWLPFIKFDESIGDGVASGFLSYDDDNFYFAAKISDSSPYDGNVRFATRDDDQYFYPEKSYRTEKDPKTGEIKRVQELTWPEGVRKYSYRRGPDLPSGDGTDSVQIAFNVLPIDQTDWIDFAPGTMPKYQVSKSTDYEYALNQVSAKHGGGTEIWRLLAPGTPRKHFYPRQGKAEKDGGPVENGKLSIVREGNTRIVEMALPWSEIPEVRKQLDANQPIKFSFRVNDNKGQAYELNTGRSVSKANTYSFHDYWSTSWSPETEFVFGK